MGRASAAGWAGAVVAVAAAGLAAGFAAERRAVGTVRRRPDPTAREPFGSLHGPARVVVADDGVPLHVEEAGDPDGALTILFLHGFTLSMDCWHYQRRDLADAGRLVFYDQRSHGASGRSPREHSTIDQLGRDLFAVLQAVAPSGPVVLVGHSMGGMTVMALADQHPELFGERVVGVVLMSTSPGGVAETVLGLPALAGKALLPVAPHAIAGLERRAELVERGRRSGSDLSFVLIRRFAFGSRPAPSLVQFMERMLAATPIEVMTEFFGTFVDHDKLTALDVLTGVPTLVLVGDRDRITPAEHSRGIARALPDAHLVVLSGAGHMVMLERPALVNLHLRALFARAASARRRAASA